MSGHRHAAARLHALDAADQELVLAALPPGDQAVLRGLLDELDELGFARTDLAGQLPPPGSTPADRLRAASAPQLYELLAGEPPACVARVLAIDSWPFAADLLDMFPAPRRDRIAAMLAERRPVPPALARMLVESLAARLPAGAAPSAPRTLFAPLERLLKAWIR